MPQGQTLAQMVRAKYPGAYDDMDDAALESAVKAKFPGVYDDLQTSGGTTSTAKPDDSSMLGSVGDFAAGVGKSVLGTIEGGGKLIRSIPVVGEMLSKGPELEIPVSTQPSNAAQSVGKATGDIAQFFAPTSVLNKAKTALNVGSRVGNALIRAGLEGAASAGVDAVQRGTTEGIAGTGAASAVTSAGMGAALKGMTSLGEQVGRALIKPTTTDRANGFLISNVYKHNLGGTLEQTLEKSSAKLKDLSGKLRTTLQNTQRWMGPHSQVDVLGALSEAAQELSQRSARTLGQNADIERAVSKFLDDPAFQTIAKGGTADLVTANEIKQGVGELGAWLHDPSGRMVRDPDSKAMEMVANAFYSKLRERIEKAAIGPLRDLNRQMAEIIPIREAVIRRIPVAERQNVVTLGDMIGFGTGAWGIALANRILRAGQTANVLVKGAEQMSGAPSVGAKVVGAGASQVSR